MINIQVFFRFFALTLFFLFPNQASAESNVKTIADKGKVFVSIDLDEGDIIYWHKKTKMGLPTRIEIYDETNVANYLIDWPWPKVKDEGHIITPYYSNKVMIPIYIKPNSIRDPSTFKINLSYLLCNRDGCFPKSQHLDAKLYDYSELVFNVEKVADKVYFLKGKLVVETGLQSHADIMILHNNELYLPESYTKNKEFLDYYFTIDNLKDYGKIEILNSISSHSQAINISEIKTESKSSGILFYALFAILGGFILNLMPCVLPVLSLKIYSLTNTKDLKERKIESLISFITIVTYFLLIGLLTASAKEAGSYFIPGFNLQKPPVLLACLILITIVISVVRGKFNVNLDSIMPNFYFKSRYVNVVFTTLVSTILATPCTAPFLATSITFALSQSTDTIIFMFLLSSLGFGFPYLMIIFFPKLLKFIPKSGKWQEWVKNLSIAMLMLTIVWLMWVLYAQLGLYPTIAALFITYFIRVSIEEEILMKYKIFVFLVAIFAMFTIPDFVSRSFRTLESNYEKTWESFSNEKLDKYLKNKEYVFVYATAQWCATCEVNKILTLDRLPAILLFRKYNVKLMEADLTNPNEEANKFLLKNGSAGLPFAKLYTPTNQKGVALPVLITYSALESALSQNVNN